jgi:hypothetical protein
MRTGDNETRISSNIWNFTTVVTALLVKPFRLVEVRLQQAFEFPADRFGAGNRRPARRPHASIIAAARFTDLVSSFDLRRFV